MTKDVCDVLEHSDVSKACERLKSYEKLVRTLFVSGQNRDVLCISEPGLYRLVLTSRKPQAEPFQDWVCQEVLPTIRKTGTYSVQSAAAPISASASLPTRDVIDYIEAANKLEQMRDSTLKMLLSDSLVDELALRRNNSVTGGKRA